MCPSRPRNAETFLKEATGVLGLRSCSAAVKTRTLNSLQTVNTRYCVPRGDQKAKSGRPTVTESSSVSVLYVCFYRTILWYGWMSHTRFVGSSRRLTEAKTPCSRQPTTQSNKQDNLIVLSFLPVLLLYWDFLWPTR